MNTLKLHKKDKYTIIEIDNGKVNAITDELMNEINQVFIDLEKDESNFGAILTGRTHCFSAGLDVIKLAKGGKSYSESLWKHYLNACKSMVEYSKPFVCAISGYAPAAATVVALCADYRIMAKGEKHVMGLQEFNMSLPIPETMSDIYAYHMGEKHAWEAIQMSKTYHSDEAVKMGLVNESLEAEEVLLRAEKVLKKLLYVIPPVYAHAKKNNKRELIKIVNKDHQTIIDDIVLQGSSPEIAQLMSMFLAKINQN